MAIYDAILGVTAWLNGLNDWLYTWVMILALVGTGIFLSIRTRAVQLRHFTGMVTYLTQSRHGSRGGISSFQAFAIGMSTRIGIGNITGIALAMILGGPGSLFWMWIVAIVGMSTAFAEATLAQIFKFRHRDGTFRGGPASYIMDGVKSPRLAIVFASAMVFCMFIAMPMVQANTIAKVVAGAHGIDPAIIGVVIAGLTALVLFGGVRRVARATEVISPLMALFYLGIAAVIIIVNITAIPQFFIDVFSSAFGLREAFVGTGSGFVAALLNGTRRGLFSNEAGMGTSPNAAATATVNHPVQQGLIQAFGVFLDTIFICTATGFIISTTGALDYSSVTPDDAAHITTDAITSTLGSWMIWPVSVMIFFFGFSSLLGAYAYGEANLVFLKKSRVLELTSRAVLIASSFMGSVMALTFVWAVMDLAMFAVTILNLIAIIGLAPWVIALLGDYEKQIAEGNSPVFRADQAQLPGSIPSDVW
ncbi:alanine/glycine:cation symporter family protein [Arcanobacterium pinnipediorum]|uniref:Alanine:cation symporter family protein n=1 Tax=Arcanobacterium pinnipediorum TaxID=1503041 RepID=A0ABY5AHW6_9ACTO|nr:alanine/glycine:cation symporter family protein [Arcanobacterium pinnipediorum]USR79596.1 alanine:cation symporter family protein [Arcanobacterium pinnipediorum]